MLPGFYDAYAATIEAFPQAQTIVGQAFIIDDHDIWTGVEGPRPPIGGGILNDFVERVACHWLVTCPSVVVKRSVYEEMGAYCTLFNSCCDWDLFLRLGLHSPVASVAKPLSVYRHTDGSQSMRLTATGLNVWEANAVVSTNLARLDQAGRPRPGDTTSWRVRVATQADWDARVLGNGNNLEGRYIQARWAWILDPTAKRLSMLLRSWLKLKRAGTPFATR